MEDALPAPARRPARPARTADIACDAPADRCPAERALELIGGRWKVVILYRLFSGPLRFSELRRAIPGVTQKVLTQQLREMEADGLLTRKVYAQVPPKVVYTLTPLGRSLRPIVEAMCKWGSRRGKCR